MPDKMADNLCNCYYLMQDRSWCWTKCLLHSLKAGTHCHITAQYKRSRDFPRFWDTPVLGSVKKNNRYSTVPPPLFQRPQSSSVAASPTEVTYISHLTVSHRRSIHSSSHPLYISRIVAAHYSWFPNLRSHNISIKQKMVSIQWVVEKLLYVFFNKKVLTPWIVFVK